MVLLIATALTLIGRLITASNLCSGVTAEGLVKGFCQCGRETNSVTEGRQYKAQDRVVCSTRTLDIDRLDVEQATANGQSQQVTSDNRGIRQIQNIELRSNCLIGVVGVLDLSRTGDRRRGRKRDQP